MIDMSRGGVYVLFQAFLAFSKGGGDVVWLVYAGVGSLSLQFLL